ncbi:hypothetical protein RGG60_002212 [Acinetobacter baumannii]|nr:hypothetical protein [Acinetobacter baumannii]
MQAVTKKQFLEIANELAQQQDEYFEGLVIDTFKIEGGIFVFGAKGMNGPDGKLSAHKFVEGNKLIGKIEPILRSKYIIID